MSFGLKNQGHRQCSCFPLLLCYMCHGFRTELEEKIQDHALAMCSLSVVYLWLINIVYWNHLRKNHKHWKLEKKKRSDIFAIIKLVIEHSLQQLTHVHPPGFTLAGTLQARRHATTPEFLKHMFQKARNSEREAIFIFV